MTKCSTNHVTIIEVGPRDGLQNEPIFVDSQIKINLINQLAQSGLQQIEATSFVSPKSIPQLADSIAVYTGIHKPKNVIFSALVPNTQGMQQAITCQVQKIAIFTAASESFNQRNIHCSIAESILRFQPVTEMAKQHNIPIRAYISCALGCPYEGEIKPNQVIPVVEKLLALGVSEISFGDTIGVGTPKQTLQLITSLKNILPKNQIAMHFHDTYGQAIANIYVSLDNEIRHFDSAIAGLGGCPYARGATGNVATEDVLYLMHGLGMETGIDIYKVVTIGDQICKQIGRKNQSKVANALLANPIC